MANRSACAALTLRSKFDVLGVKPIQGRLFTTGEEAPGKGNVVVIGWSLWQRRFGGLNVEGKLLDFDGRRFAVIGVMPLGFAFPDKNSEFWAPLVVSERAKRRGGYWLQMVGRLKPGATVAQAQAEMDVVGKQLEQQYPDENTGYGIFVNSLVNHVAGNVRTPLLILLGAVGFVLLIACVNVAGLFLTRAEARSREIMVRSAMGASRASIIRQLVMEAAALAAVAGATGTAAAYGGVRALLWLAPKDLPRLDEIALDGWALVFGLGLTTLTAFLFGLWPAWRLSCVEIQDALRGSGRGMAGAHGAARARGALVVVECALAITLLSGASLLLRSLGALRGMDTGYRTAKVLTMRVNASNTRYPQGPQLRQFYDQLLARVRALPGVTNAAATTNLFLSNTPSSGTFTLEDRAPFPPSEQIEATIDTVSPGFFETMQARLVRGRFLDEHDWENAPRAAVINETFASRYWPNQNPIGQHFVFGDRKPGPNESWITIVGVIGDMRRRGLHQGARLEVFFPSGQNSARNMQLLITSSGPSLPLVPAVRAAIRALDPSAPVTEISTVEAEIGESLAVRRFQVQLLSLFSVLAVLLAAVGIFGLMAQLVVRRTPEIGVRMALGATPREVLKMVLRQGVLSASVGAAAGIGGALALGRVLKSLLFGVSAFDPISYAGAIAVMALAVLLACGLPAWRASRVDPMVALRNDG
jgi:putative ABC transport system permease protein